MADTNAAGSIISAKDFESTPVGLHRKWLIELKAAEDNQKKWVGQADKADKRYRGEMDASSGAGPSRLNLYHATINTVLAVLYGQVPKVDVSRRFDDANDDVARVSAEAFQRHLNTDIEDDADDFQREAKDCIQDWKITGLGVARLRYETEMEDVPEDSSAEPVIPAYQKKTSEDVCTESVHWRDFRWSPCRRWKEVRWVAFCNEMTRDALVDRFGEEIGKRVPLQSRKYDDGSSLNNDLKEAWSRARVWEIWDKESRKVHWFCEGFDRLLDSKDDPMGLKGFFPCPRPLVANATTTKMMPKPDLELDRDLYDEIDTLADRLRELVSMARVSGAYNKAFPELGDILRSREGSLIGVSGWEALSEKGGVGKQMEFVPLDAIVKAIEVLTSKLVEKIQLLYQATGLSDIMRGDSTRRETATEVRAKAGFASTRIQTDQDEVARFASDLQRLRAEIISRHYDEQTIIERSNLERVEVDPVTKQPNLQLIDAAVQLIKSDFWQYRIEVKADSIALRDYAALKAERVETIAALAGLFQQAVPMVQMGGPKIVPFLMEIGKWLIASCKGSQQLEASFDRLADEAEAAAQQPPPPPQPDPKLQAAQVKADAEKTKAQIGVVQSVIDAKAHMQKTGMDMQRAHSEHQMAMEKNAAQQQTAMIKAATPPAQGAPNV